MAFRIVFFGALVAVARAGLVPAPIAAPIATTYHAAPAIAKIATPIIAQRYAPAPVIAHAAPVAKAIVADADFDPNPQYSYSYDIQDALTGDNKNHIESRNGDVVQGSYSLVDPDGTRRTVEYTADPINGFNAVVHREPLVNAIAAAPVVAKVATPAVAYAAPVAKIATPLAYATPVAKVAHIAAPVSYAAPIARVATPLSYAAPVAKLASPIAYAGAPITKIYH